MSKNKAAQQPEQPMQVNTIVNIAKPERPKKNKRMMVFLYSLLFLALCGAVVLYIVFFNPLSRFERFMDNDNFSYAARVYSSRIVGNLEHERGAKELVDNKIEEVKQGYFNEQTDADAARQSLDAIGQIGEPFAQPAKQAADWVSDIADSRSAYAMGVSLAQSGDYAGALDSFSNVVKDDASYYQKAQDEISKNERNYAEVISGDVTELIAAGKLDEALLEYKQKSAYIKTDETAKKTMDETAAQLTSSALDSAAALAAAPARDYKAAVDLLDKALDVFPKDEQLLGAKTEYQRFLPYYIADLEPSATGGAGLKLVDAFTDNQANAYAGNIYTTDTAAPVYNEYEIDGGYTSLRGSFAIGENGSATRSCYLRIYADGRMVYQGVLSPGSAPIAFNVNIAGAETVRIELEGAAAAALDPAFYA